MKRMTVLGLALAASTLYAACSKQPQAPAPSPAPAAPPATAPAAPPPAPEAAARQKLPEGAKVSFVGIKDGDTVTSPFKVGFGVEGITIAPAGTTTPGTGHFHLIVDSDLPPQDAPLPADEHVEHFGKGQTETEVSLPAGQHTLQLEVTDGNHVPFDPPAISDKITVTVK